MEVKLAGIRRTEKGNVVAYLFLSDGVGGVKFRLYTRRRGAALGFDTTNKGRAELALRLLKELGVDAKVYHKKDWHIFASLRGLAGADRTLKEAVTAAIVAAAERGWIDAKRAQRWVAKMGCVRTYSVGEKLAVYSKHPEVLECGAQRLREMGLVEGRHFTLKMPEDGAVGCLRILAKGLAYIAWLSIHGSGRQRELAGEFLGKILRAAQAKGGVAYRRVKRAVEAGMTRGSLTLTGLEKEVDGRMVRIRGGSAWLEDGRLKIAVEAEVDGVEARCEASFVKMKKGGVAGFVRADTAEDVKRIAVVIKAVTGISPTVVRMNNGAYLLRCNEKHLKTLIRYAELADYLEKWIDDMGF
jgi:hypothetical protein